MDELKANAAIADFAFIVERYCSWAESPFSEPDQEMQAARKLLAELHLAALNLPEDLDCGEEVEAPQFSDEWEIVCKRFRGLPVDIYWDIFDPLEEDQPIANTLWDDLTDIYRDLKKGLWIYKQGLIIEAVWEWKFGFQVHWGAHLTGAQRAIHSYFS